MEERLQIIINTYQQKLADATLENADLTAQLTLARREIETLKASSTQEG